MATFDNVKVGDKVIFYPSWGPGIPTTVTRVTPAGNFTTEETDKVLWDKNGNARGSGVWSRSCVRPYSEEEYAQIMEARIICKAKNLMNEYIKSDLTVEQAKTIIEILENQ